MGEEEHTPGERAETNRDEATVNDGETDGITGSQTTDDSGSGSDSDSSSSSGPTSLTDTHVPESAASEEASTAKKTPSVDTSAHSDDISSSTNTADLDGGGRDRSSTDVDLDGVVLDDDGDNQGLFDDLLSGEPIFENKEVLRPSYTPHELPHRNDQINRMATILVSALRGETPSNILIYGKTGTGKTASAKFVSQELESTSQKYDVPCEVEYINCEVTDTQYRVLAQLANTFIEKNQAVIEERIERCQRLESAASDDPAALESTEFATIEEVEARIDRLRDDADGMEEVPMTGWPTDRVYTTFFDAVDYHERVVVIMLDEIDKLVE